MTELLARPKFRLVLAKRYPVLLIDEYQDTDAGFVEALKQHFLGTGPGHIIGLFGDHWLKIYGEGCGAVEHAALEEIAQPDNFRTAAPTVQVLQHKRPDIGKIPRKRKN